MAKIRVVFILFALAGAVLVYPSLSPASTHAPLMQVLAHSLEFGSLFPPRDDKSGSETKKPGGPFPPKGEDK